MFLKERLDKLVKEKDRTCVTRVQQRFPEGMV
jgi:hypothetical protein